MSRFINAGIGIVSSITEAPRPPIEIVSEVQDKAGFSLTNGTVAATELAVVLELGQFLTLVNNGGSGYTDGAFTNQPLGANANNYAAAINQQTTQGNAATGVPNPGALTVDYEVVAGQVVNLRVGNNVGTNTNSGDTFTINGGDADNLARFMIP